MVSSYLYASCSDLTPPVSPLNLNATLDLVRTWYALGTPLPPDPAPLPCLRHLAPRPGPWPLAALSLGASRQRPKGPCPEAPYLSRCTGRSSPLVIDPHDILMRSFRLRRRSRSRTFCCSYSLLDNITIPPSLLYCSHYTTTRYKSQHLLC